MKAFANIQLLALADTLLSLFTAFVLGAVVGFERQFRQRTAGLRTNVLVSLGAAIFVDMAFRLSNNDGAVRVIAYVVSGVGFLGAGAIMREEGNVRGLNTAATLWGVSGDWRLRRSRVDCRSRACHDVRARGQHAFATDSQLYQPSTRQRRLYRTHQCATCHCRCEPTPNRHDCARNGAPARKPAAFRTGCQSVWRA